MHEPEAHKRRQTRSKQRLIDVFGERLALKPRVQPAAEEHRQNIQDVFSEQAEARHHKKTRERQARHRKMHPINQRRAQSQHQSSVQKRRARAAGNRRVCDESRIGDENLPEASEELRRRLHGKGEHSQHHAQSRQYPAQNRALFLRLGRSGLVFHTSILFQKIRSIRHGLNGSLQQVGLF